MYLDLCLGCTASNIPAKKERKSIRISLLSMKGENEGESYAYFKILVHVATVLVVRTNCSRFYLGFLSQDNPGSY